MTAGEAGMSCMPLDAAAWVRTRPRIASEAPARRGFAFWGVVRVR